MSAIDINDSNRRKPTHRTYGGSYFEQAAARVDNAPSVEDLIKQAVSVAVAEEREECAKIAEEHAGWMTDAEVAKIQIAHGKVIADAIRAKGKSRMSSEVRTRGITEEAARKFWQCESASPVKEPQIHPRFMCGDTIELLSSIEERMIKRGTQGTVLHFFVRSGVVFYSVQFPNPNPDDLPWIVDVRDDNCKRAGEDSSANAIEMPSPSQRARESVASVRFLSHLRNGEPTQQQPEPLELISPEPNIGPLEFWKEHQEKGETESPYVIEDGLKHWQAPINKPISYSAGGQPLFTSQDVEEAVKAEREACAALMDEVGAIYTHVSGQTIVNGMTGDIEETRDAAAVIRARGDD